MIRDKGAIKIIINSDENNNIKCPHGFCDLIYVEICFKLLIS